MAFVKFQRGTTTAYNNLTKKDPDSLYFIYDDNNSEEGLLYLGARLIGGTSETLIKKRLSQLEDVDIGNSSLEEGMILQYNNTTNPGYWEPISLEDAFAKADFQFGTSVSIAEKNENESINEALNRVEPTPQAGDIILLDNEPYIFNGTDWVSLNDSLESRVDSLESDITDLQTKVGESTDVAGGVTASGLYADIERINTNLENIYTKNETDIRINNAISAAGHLKYETANSVAEIDTSKTNTIFLIPMENSINDNQYDEYLVTATGAIEKVGSKDIDLSNYVQNDDNRLLTDDQKTKLDNLVIDEDGQIAVSGIINAANVQGLEDAIRETQLIKSVEVGTFNVTNQGQLQLISVPNSVLNFNPDDFILKSAVGNLSDLPNNGNSSIVEEINLLNERLTWVETLE